MQLAQQSDGIQCQFNYYYRYLPNHQYKCRSTTATSSCEWERPVATKAWCICKHCQIKDAAISEITYSLHFHRSPQKQYFVIWLPNQLPFFWRIANTSRSGRNLSPWFFCENTYTQTTNKSKKKKKTKTEENLLHSILLARCRFPLLSCIFVCYPLSCRLFPHFQAKFFQCSKTNVMLRPPLPFPLPPSPYTCTYVVSTVRYGKGKIGFGTGICIQKEKT